MKAGEREMERSMQRRMNVRAALTAATAACLVCPKGSQWAPGTGCVSNAVVRQAKHNCLYGPAHSKDWPQCVCNDGGKVAACGD